MTLKNWARSLKPKKVFIIPQSYIKAKLVPIRPLVYDVSCFTPTLMPKINLFSSTVTLKIRARSPKPYQVVIMPQCYIHLNLIPICLLVHAISCTQKCHVKEVHTKNNMPPPLFGGGHNNSMFKSLSLKIIRKKIRSFLVRFIQYFEADFLLK